MAVDPSVTRKFLGDFRARMATQFPAAMEGVSDDFLEESLKLAKLQSFSPVDARFPNTSQAHHCWARYNEFLLCVKKTGAEESCQVQRIHFQDVCPSKWVENFTDHKEKGVFMGIN